MLHKNDDVNLAHDQALSSNHKTTVF